MVRSGDYLGRLWRSVARFAALSALVAGGLMGRPVAAQDITGTWQGTMQAGKPQRIVVKVAKDAGGGWQGVVYSLDSSMAYEGRATTQMSLQGGEMRFAIAPIDSSYQGKVSTDAGTIAGTWTQSGTSSPLNLARVTGDAAWEIPKADAMMAKDADPDWDVVSVKEHDPNDPSNNQSLNFKGRRFVMSNRAVEGLLLFASACRRCRL